MSGKTLDYGSVGKWMSLALRTENLYREWLEKHPYGNRTDEDFVEFFHQIAVDALDNAFSLRAGHRSWAVYELLKAIAPDDSGLHVAFYRIDRETWLTPPGAKPKR